MIFYLRSSSSIVLCVWTIAKLGTELLMSLDSYLIVMERLAKVGRETEVNVLQSSCTGTALRVIGTMNYNRLSCPRGARILPREWRDLWGSPDGRRKETRGEPLAIFLDNQEDRAG